MHEIQTGWAVTRRVLLRLCAVLVLLAGLGGAVVLYINAPDEAAAGDNYVIEGGVAYRVSPWDSRSYQRNLEYLGGKSAVLMTQAREWLAAAWNASTQAVLLACVSALAAAFLLYLAEPVPDAIPDAGPPPDPPGTAGPKSPPKHPRKVPSAFNPH